MCEREMGNEKDKRSMEIKNEKGKQEIERMKWKMLMRKNGKEKWDREMGN